METADQTNDSLLAGTFSKILHIRAATGVASVDGINKKTTVREKIKPDFLHDKVDEKLMHKMALDAPV